MLERSRRQVVGALAAGVLVVVLGALWVRMGEPAPPAPAEVRMRGADGRAAGGGGGLVVVHVAGAVRRPGVYRVRPGMRIAGALRRAGGATRRADLAALNLAARVEDGRQVLVPVRTAGGVAPAPDGSVVPRAGAGAPAAVVVNLNTATLEQLDTLPGVGPATAGAILAYRQEHGGFGSVDELDQVPGIGPATLDALRDLVGV